MIKYLLNIDISKFQRKRNNYNQVKIPLDNPVPDAIKNSENPKEKFEWLYSHVDQILDR